jgi:Uma2 family endonuclease
MMLAALPTPVDALAPLRLAEDLQLTPEQFVALCQANPNAVLEPDASGHLIQMTPTGSETGARNSRLPDGSVLSPDLVAELASPSDEGPRSFNALRRKMAAYKANGAQLGWL